MHVPFQPRTSLGYNAARLQVRIVEFTDEFFAGGLLSLLW